MWIFNLVSDTVSLFGGILELLDDGVELVCLVLEGLHLLPDGVHGVGGAELSNELSLTKKRVSTHNGKAIIHRAARAFEK